MNITELGAIGELVGGVAVIASLVYVGLQVRQSTQVGRAQAVTTRLSGQMAAELALKRAQGCSAALGGELSQAAAGGCGSSASL